MATLSDLEDGGEITRILVRLISPDTNRRSFYALPALLSWMQSALPSLTSMDPHDLTPKQQLFALLQRYNSGEALQEGEDFKIMVPHDNDVYEFRSADVRIYGWFYRPSVFIGVNASTMEISHSYVGLASGFRNEVVTKRNLIPLDEPKYEQGATSSHVFQLST